MKDIELSLNDLDSVSGVALGDIRASGTAVV
jgi:hypothetical protein